MNKNNSIYLNDIDTNILKKWRDAIDDIIKDREKIKPKGFIDFEISRRSSGKTTKLTDIFCYNYKIDNGTIYITINNNMSKMVMELLREKLPWRYYANIKNNFYTQETINNSVFLMKHINCIVIDDYLFFYEKNQRKLNALIDNYINTKNPNLLVFIKTTASKLYNKVIFEKVVSDRRKLKNYYRYLIINDADVQEYNELCCNLLTHPLTKISSIEDFKKMMPEEQVDIEYKGEWLKGDDI